MRSFIIFMLTKYQQHLSPYLGGACRFTPSCSEYAIGCIRRYGSIIGFWLAIRRVIRCQPEWPCGEDPVPKTNQVRAAMRGELIIPNPCSKKNC